MANAECPVQRSQQAILSQMNPGTCRCHDCVGVDGALDPALLDCDPPSACFAPHVGDPTFVKRLHRLIPYQRRQMRPLSRRDAPAPTCARCDADTVARFAHRVEGPQLPAEPTGFHVQISNPKPGTR